jgi:hypothetical protein
MLQAQLCKELLMVVFYYYISTYKLSLIMDFFVYNKIKECKENLT